MKERVIELSRVCYSYPAGTEALKDVSLHVLEGERVAILGPNGAGKSTLFLLMSGLAAAQSGEVRLFGEQLTPKIVADTKHMFSIRKRLGIVFQDPDVQLFSSTIYEDVAFGPLHLGIGENELAERVLGALKLFGIAHLKDKHPYELSGGEKRKAAIASVMSIDPEVVLFDEPTADLDPASRRKVIDLINSLHQRGKTIVVSTHDVDAVPLFADRVYVLNRTVLGEGTPREVFSDEVLLEEANLEPPHVIRLVKAMRALGCDVDMESIEQIIHPKEHSSR